MKKIIVYLLLFVFIASFSVNKWEKAACHTDGNLIIATLRGTERFNNADETKIITVDSDWSVLILQGFNKKEGYFIFNNITKQIYKTKSFKQFIEEIKKIPDNTIITEIDKCTVSCSMNFSEEKRNELEQLIKEKNCELNNKLMFCTCKHNYEYNL